MNDERAKLNALAMTCLLRPFEVVRLANISGFATSVLMDYENAVARKMA